MTWELTADQGSNDILDVEANKDYYQSPVSGLVYPTKECSTPWCNNKEPLSNLDARGLCSDCQVNEARQAHIRGESTAVEVC